MFNAPKDGGNVNVFAWSGANEFLLSCSAEHIGVGGGGSFAMCMDEDLQNTTCGPSTTFVGLEARSLLSQATFRIGVMELWGFEQFSSIRSGSNLGERDMSG